MTWWMWGVGTAAAPDPGTTADNAPSLWGGGIRWGDPAAPFGDGTDGYWGAPMVATGREGRPRLSVAIAGGLVLDELRSATWTLGRPDWMSTLTPTSASFEFVDKPGAHINDPIVVGLMSDATEYHSDALWVGRVTDVTTNRDLNDIVTTTISATDVIGVLGQAESPTSISAGHTLVTLVEQLAEEAGLGLQVDTDPLVTLPTLTAASDLSGKVLDLVNRAERSSNALLFLKGNGRLHAAMRDTTGASSVPVIDLDGDDSPSGWTESVSLRNVVTRWQLGGESWDTDTEATTLEEYGDQTFSATDLLISDPSPYAPLIASDVMAHPRAIVVEAPFPVRDMGQRVLFLNPLDRVHIDGVTWQVMQVSHSVAPIELEDGKRSAWGDWRITIAADQTQEALVEAPEPGPVTPPGENEVVVTTISTKARYINSDVVTDPASTDLRTGKVVGFTTVNRILIEFPIVWPDGFQEVVGAKLRIKTASSLTNTGSDPRIRVMRNLESWTEDGAAGSGPKATSYGNRVVDVPRVTDRWVEVSILNIARFWHEENNGLVIRASDESDVTRRAAFHSDDATEADRPRLILTCRVIT